jgi:hypothetical protein
MRREEGRLKASPGVASIRDARSRESSQFEWPVAAGWKPARVINQSINQGGETVARLKRSLQTD